MAWVVWQYLTCSSTGYENGTNTVISSVLFGKNVKKKLWPIPWITHGHSDEQKGSLYISNVTLLKSSQSDYL